MRAWGATTTSTSGLVALMAAALWVACAVACAADDSFELEDTSGERNWTPPSHTAGSTGSGDSDSGSGGTGTGGDSSQPTNPGLGIEACDGFDNDRDGEVDEGTDGLPCITNWGSQGKTYCIRGSTECYECEPGETRENNCGCSETRRDECSNSGRWLDDVCDGCPAPTACAIAGACVPGEERMMRCDTCGGDSAETCGSKCIGATYRCTEECTWEPANTCASREAECDSDVIKIEPCGKCGFRELTCDGCFWNLGECRDQGECTPGEKRTIPCFDRACGPGFTRTITCSDQCEWETPTPCSGCSPGETTDETVECAPGYDCGIKTTRVECIGAQQVSICNGDDELTVGIRRERVIRNDCIYNECLPGQTTTSPCTTGLGQCGTTSVGCTGTCDWAEPDASAVCTPRPDSCIPGTVRTEVVSCGANACGMSRTFTYTCRADGCGESVSVSGSCPACQVGDTRGVGCHDGSGRCGSGTLTCTASCTWPDASTVNGGACTPSPSSCVPGTTDSDEVSCGGGSCGATYTTTRTCASNGCGWTYSQSGSCPSCSAGQVDTNSCTTASGQCGSMSRTCSSSTCEWGGFGTCVALPTACNPGETRTEACSNGCNAGEKVYRCNGCGWDLVQACDAAPGECSPGNTDSVSCAPCPGSKSRSCTSACTWSPWSSCPPCG